MTNTYIQKSDLPTANFTDLARLYAGKGWLSLVQEAMPDIGTALICAIREDSGLLRIELASTYTDMRKQAIQLAQLKSAKTCEICGEPGSLRHELKNGKPAGWHRTRCDQHIDTRKSSWEMPRRAKEPSSADLSTCMTAGQLIEILKNHPEDTPVLVEGYETGFDEIHKVQTIAAEVNQDAEEWDGQYQSAEKGSPCLFIVGRRDSYRIAEKNIATNVTGTPITNATADQLKQE